MNILEYFESITKRILNKEIIKQFAEKQHKVQKQVCCKNINEHQIGFSCYSCTDDPCVIYCSKCFLNSNHDGHRWEAKKDNRGQCDCGDIVAIQPSAFCTTHQIQQQRTIISNTDNLVTVMEELWFFVNQETHEEDVLEIIADSEALTHIVSVLCLISDEIMTVQELMKSITSNNYEIFYKQSKQLSCNSLFSRQLRKQQSIKLQLYAEILPSDQFFKIYSFRQIGLYVNTIIETSNDNIIDSMIQIMNEPLGLFYAGKWGTLDAINQGIYDFTTKIHKNGKQIIVDQLQQTVDSIIAFQRFSFIKTFTAMHSILYDSDSYFENIQNIQYTLVKAYALDPNAKYENGHQILNKYTIFSQLLVYMCLPNYEIFNWLDLKHAEEKDAELLCIAHTQKSKRVDKLFTTDNIDFHVQKVVKLLKSALQQEERDNVFNFAPLCVPQLYLCSVSRIYKVSIQVLVNKVHQSFSDMQLNDLLKKMVRQLIIAQKWHILIDQHKIFKQNLADFQQSKQFFDQIMGCLFLRYQQIFIIQCLLPLIDDWYPFIQAIFDNDQEALLNFISLIIYLPLNVNQTDQLKFLLSSTFTEILTLQFLYDSSLNQIFSKNQICQVCDDIFTSKQLLPLQNEKLELKTLEFVEPMFASNLEAFYQNVNVLPERVTNNAVNPLCSSLFNFKFLQNLGAEVIIKFKKNEVSVSSCMSALRILDCCGINIQSEILDINNPKISQLYKVQPINNQNMSAAKRKMMLFQNRKVDNESESVLLQQLKTEGEKQNECGNDECVICHMPIEEIYYVPLQTSLHVNVDNHIHQCGELVQINKICPHKHHLTCILESEEHVCSICKMEFQQVLMQLINTQTKYYDFDDSSIPAVKNEHLIQRSEGGMNSIFQHISYIEYLLKVQQIDIQSQQFTEILSNVISIIKSFLVVVKINKQLIPSSHLKIIKLASYDVFQMHLLDQIDFTSFTQSLSTQFEKKQFFTTKLNLNTHNLFRQMLTKPPHCQCKQKVNLQSKDAITTQCLACGCFTHGQCLSLIEGFFVCPKCNSNLGQLFLERNVIAKSSTMVYKGLYQTKFGENSESIYGEELHLKEKNIDYLAFLLATNTFSKIVDVHDIKYLCEIFPVTQVQQMDLSRLVAENRITEEQIEMLFDEAEELEESEED
ncbi:Putative_zinc finger in N-recognin (UBR box) and ring finger domain-containing protein [Hexamita inflata]|uniref:E3 ubiquitin-protein ligase n=2 Tax=Hexamita inflata TaxID=28002 RepID=A0ABP1KHA1_9EUKA